MDCFVETLWVHMWRSLSYLKMAWKIFFPQTTLVSFFEATTTCWFSFGFVETFHLHLLFTHLWSQLLKVMQNAHETQPNNINIHILLFYFVGPFLLTNLLLDKMKITAKETNKEGHIVIVSSYAHFWAPKEGISFDKLNERTRLIRERTKPSFHEIFHRVFWEI